MNRLIILLFVISSWSCAQIVAPTGGEEDIIPPEIIAVNPEKFSVNFSSTEIELEFDEYVRVNRWKDQFIASPPLKYPIVTKVKGKKVILSIKDTLLENSTYLFRFGKSIVDITENNPLSDFTYVFSTGTYIDSLQLSGRVKTAESDEALENSLVMLYSDEGDSLPYKQLPKYLCKTDELGNFQFENLAEGDYQVFALLDENDNFLYDQVKENIAFLNEPVRVAQNNEPVELLSFIAENEIQYVKKQEENGPVLKLIMNKSGDAIQIAALDTLLDDILIQQETSKLSDTLIYWFKSLEETSFSLELSTDSSVIDTIKVNLDSLTETLQVKPFTSVDFFKDLSLKFNFPIASMDTSRVLLFSSDSVKLPFQITRGKTPLNWNLKHPWKSKLAYRLLILPGAFEDIYAQTLDSLEQSFIVSSPEDFGNLVLKIQDDNKISKLVQVIQGQNIVKQVFPIEGNATFNNLSPGSYQIRLVYDSNANGKWDTGNYPLRVQPENCIIFNEQVQIRANWDKEIEWKID